MPAQRLPPPPYSSKLFRHLSAVQSAHRLDQWLWLIHPADRLASTGWCSIHVPIDSRKFVTFMHWDLFSSLKTSIPKLRPLPLPSKNNYAPNSHKYSEFLNAACLLNTTRLWKVEALTIMSSCLLLLTHILSSCDTVTHISWYKLQFRAGTA